MAAPWTDEELDYARLHYGHEPIDLIASHLGRTNFAVRSKLSDAGISLPRFRWNNAATTRLKELMEIGMSDAEIAIELDTTVSSVASRRIRATDLRRKSTPSARPSAPRRRAAKGELPRVPQIEGVDFRLVPEFPAYAIGNDGSPWSSHSGTWRRLVPGIMPSGHLHVNLHQDGSKRTFRLHRLVLELFVGPCPEGMEAMHTPDPDPTNNRVTNLKWGTRKENQQESSQQARNNWGTNNPHAKLSEADIPEIFRLRREGLSLWAIANRFSIHQEAIRGILIGRAWKPISRPLLEQEACTSKEAETC